jgi:NitT/TauT family transport system permease protein
VNVGARLVSLALLIAAWYAGSQLAGARLLPDPQAVALAIVDEARSGALAFNLGATLARVAVAFIIAMALGSVIGLIMGRSRIADQLGDPWLIVLLNLPALVIIVLAYVWAGLTETAAIAAVALNKLPIATVTVREGARSLDHALDDMAQVFRMGAWTRLRHVILPQLAPYLAAAARSGLSLVWKIVLIVELLGRPNGVGFEIGVAFQLFDVTRILAYALAFIAIMLAIETFLDADDDGLAPTAMTSLQRLAHHRDVARTVEGIVGAADLVSAALRHVDEIRDEIAADLFRIDEMRHAEALTPLFFAVVDVDADDHVGAGKPQALDDVEADAAEPEHDALRARLHLGGIEDSADTGGDAAADVADLVERSVLANFGDGDLGQHREIRKRGRAHVMVQLLAIE